MLPFYVKFWKWKWFFFISLAILRPSQSGIHWPIDFSKKKDNSVYFQKNKKKSKLKRREGSFQLVKLSKLCYHLLSSFENGNNFFFISLAIPYPLRSGIHWPITFSWKIDVSVYYQKLNFFWQVHIGISILVIPDHM